MRRSVLLWLAVAVAVWFSQSCDPQTDRGEAHTASGRFCTLVDRDVIQTALLRLIPSWSRPDHPVRAVILGTQYASTTRKPFGPLLDREIDQVHRDIYNRVQSMNHFPMSMRDLHRLMLLRRAGNRGSFLPPEIRPLTSYSWDKRILLAVPAAYRPGAKSRLSYDEGYLTASLPSYSPDGNACILDVNRPWGTLMHETDTLLLLRLKGRWDVAYLSVFTPM